ncbi:MAG: hypothetical protein AABX05_01180, partial [Nanoarchaeota archaeon]
YKKHCSPLKMTPYTLTRLRPRNGSPIQQLVAPIKKNPASDEITGLEAALRQKYGNVDRKGRAGRYDLFVDLDRTHHSDRIITETRKMITPKPLSQILCYKGWDHGNLFMYFQNEPGLIYLGFRNISLPCITPRRDD